MPWLYLVGVSTNDFDQALRALFGDSVQGLSANSISRLKKDWEEEYAEWRRKDWSDREFVYLWADGIYVNVRSGAGCTSRPTCSTSCPASAKKADAKSMLHEIWQAGTREHALQVFNRFVSTYDAKYPKAVKCLLKDRDELLAFHDFPTEHWEHLRTTHPIESTFATIRLRIKKIRNRINLP